MNSETVCQACLSDERELFCVQKLKCLLINDELLNLNIGGGVCWECRTIFLKFSRFRKQVVLAQKILSDPEKTQRLKCLSNLSFSRIHTFSQDDYHEHLNSVVIIETDTVQTGVKEEIVDLKEDFEFYHDGSPNANETDVYRQDSEIKKESSKKDVKIKRKIKCKKRNKNIKLDHKSDYDIVKEKFVEVELTEEEMLKSREEKRSHPNFKKLPYNCDSCVLGFTRKENFEMHKEKKHDKRSGKHICPVCKIHLASPTSLAKHVKKHYHCFRCKLCTYETTELWSALSHCKSKHSNDSENSIHCSQCNYVAKTHEELTEHTRIKHALICTECGEKFKGRNTLRAHIRTHEELTEHTRIKHALICTECGEKFKGRNTLRAHIRRVHGKPSPHTCELCPASFRSRARLAAHAGTHGAAAAARLAYCATCRLQYKNVYVYRNHLNTSANHSERRYQCEVCNKKFTSKVYYKRHYTFFHQKSSPFKCEQCNQLFISDWRLKNHRQRHHGLARSRDHSCSDCGKKFFDTSTLKAHQLTHSSQRSFMCEDCGDTFKQRPALYNHVRLVHKGIKRQNTQ